LIVCLDGQGGQGKAGRRSGIHSSAAGLEQRKGRGRRRKEKRPGRFLGHPVSDSRKKEKESGQAGHCGRREVGRGSAGMERKVGLFFLFFFSFKTLFKFKPFHLKTFKNFSNFFHKKL
jgi:hypothetical protein